ncbi:MAG: hypothetical protein ACK5AO_04485 [bacterium]
MSNGSAVHLNVKTTFKYQEKEVAVEAICKTSYGPLGDRLYLNVSYGEEKIGNFSALRSYMGGGSNGKWPIIRTTEETILFKLSTSNMYGPENEFLIERYVAIKPDNVELNLPNEWRAVAASESLLKSMEEPLEISSLAEHKIIEWTVPVLDNHHNFIGNLSSCAYPGFERFIKSYYGNIKDFPKDWYKNEIIAQADDQCLRVVEFERNAEIELHYPWPIIHVNIKL